MSDTLTRLAMGIALTVAAAAPAQAGAGGAQPKPEARSAAPKARNARATPPNKPGFVPIPLKLPKPRLVDTPKKVPPGTRAKLPTGGPQRRKPFLAPKGARNVAKGKPVTASDPEPVIGALDMVTDGNKEATEDAYVELGPAVQWVQIDLGKPLPVYAVVVWHEHKDRRVYHDVVIQVADDKDFITNVRALFNSDHDNSAGLGIGKDWGCLETEEGLLVDAKGVRARYVRLYSNGSTADDLNRYTEVEVFGLDDKAPTGAARAKPSSEKTPLPLKLPRPRP